MASDLDTSTVPPMTLTLDLTPPDDLQTMIKDGTNLENAGEVKIGREPEEALESHEVVEINKFTERKEWIDEKIKLLENMPPVEVFAAVNAFATCPEKVPPELPTRAQHDQWLKEHDKIEKETEIFDAGDMSKLKKLTKAATQRNLSPEDTDLIEVSLTTLLALDKLLHLLRDRSEQLELLGLRLTWEEQRVIAWKERRQILEDIKTFLTTRARWSVDVYDNLNDQTQQSPYMGNRFMSPPPGPTRPTSALSLRRDSVASISSEPSIAGISFPSRSARYKLAETLSHDAAVLSGRLTTLNHAKVVAAGKTLDKFIDTSRKPVPDEILDEQDVLEDKAVKELESVGKFVMAVVMQWKRADEYYSDIIKDQSAAKALLSELANANIQHPSQKLDSSFMTRAQALTKRLALKADPKKSFLRPFHNLFPDQTAANDALVETLNVEFNEAVALAKRAEADALDYHHKVKVIKHAEEILLKMNGYYEELGAIVEQLTGHMRASDEDGDPSPPNLQTELCLDPIKHAAYVALAPPVMRKFEGLELSSESVLRTANQCLLQLNTLSVIDASFRNNLSTTINQLQLKRHEAKLVKERVEVEIVQLKEARRLWAILNGIMDKAEDVASQIGECMKVQRWKPMGNSKRAVPATPDPDSPLIIPLPLTVLAPNDLPLTLTALNEKLQSDFVVPFRNLKPLLPSSLSTHLESSFEGVLLYIKGALAFAGLWQNIADQSSAMTSIYRETEDLIHRIVSLQSGIEDLQDRILRGDSSVDSFDANESEYSARFKDIEKPVQDFVSNFPRRIPLVSWHADVRQKNRSNSISSPDHYLHRLKESSDPEPSVDIIVLNNDVRDDSNGFALKLTNAMQSLDRSRQDLHLSGIATRTDRYIEELEHSLQRTENEMAALCSSLDDILPNQPVGTNAEFIELLLSLSKEHDDISNRHTRLTPGLIQSIQEALRTFEMVASSRGDSPFCTGIISTRLKSGKEALQRANDLEATLLQFKENLESEREKEQRRLRIENEKLSTTNLGPKMSPSPPSNGHTVNARENPEEDVFGMPNLVGFVPSDLTNLRSRISTLISRLRSFNDDVSTTCYPSDASAPLPGLGQMANSQYTFSTLDNEIGGLLSGVEQSDIKAETASLRFESDKARALLQRLISLGEISQKITICDNAFSDLLEHIDHYPAPPPVATLASTHTSDSHIPCEEQLKARLIYCTDQMDSVAQASVTLNDSRVLNEQVRLRQTLLELRAMCIDRMNGTHSRPASTASSSRSASVVGSPVARTPKNKPALVGRNPKALFPSREADKSSRRSVSSSRDPAARPSTHLSNHSHVSNRSVSGPSVTSSLFSPTFASRQRTTSLASTSQPGPPAVRARALSRRPSSPTNSEVSGKAHPSTSRSTWARAPRLSFGPTPYSSSTEPRKRKTYVPNPKSKLDIAVGHVVNNFKLPVTVQIAEEGWKDQSGKYWIGDAEPKLCFCRILRSQTVMVRVGGGWSELSKFLKGHFADLLAELPPSPPKNDEKWVSSITLREEESPIPVVPRSPMTPEPRYPAILPSLQLSTPSGTSPRSIRTTSSTPESKSPGLTPFQYMRRADVPGRPSTPSSKSSLRLKPNTSNLHRAITPPRPHAWRP